MKISTKNNAEKGSVVLSSDISDMRIVEVCLTEHPGFVVHPTHLVGVSGNIQIKTRWLIGYLHSWLTGQFRYIIFYGTGCLYLEGRGGINIVELKQETVGIDEHSVMGFDTRLAFSTCRTETFYPYLKGKTSLIDGQFSGTGYFLRQISPTQIAGKTSGKKRLQFLMNIISAIGKFFGF